MSGTRIKEQGLKENSTSRAAAPSIAPVIIQCTTNPELEKKLNERLQALITLKAKDSIQQILIACNLAKHGNEVETNQYANKLVKTAALHVLTETAEVMAMSKENDTRNVIFHYANKPFKIMSYAVGQSKVLAHRKMFHVDDERDLKAEPLQLNRLSGGKGGSPDLRGAVVYMPVCPLPLKKQALQGEKLKTALSEYEKLGAKVIFVNPEYDDPIDILKLSSDELKKKGDDYFKTWEKDQKTRGFLPVEIQVKTHQQFAAAESYKIVQAELETLLLKDEKAFGHFLEDITKAINRRATKLSEERKEQRRHSPNQLIVAVPQPASANGLKIEVKRSQDNKVHSQPGLTILAPSSVTPVPSTSSESSSASSASGNSSSDDDSVKAKSSPAAHSASVATGLKVATNGERKRSPSTSPHPLGVRCDHTEEGDVDPVVRLASSHAVDAIIRRNGRVSRKVKQDLADYVVHIAEARGVSTGRNTLFGSKAASINVSREISPRDASPPSAKSANSTDGMERLSSSAPRPGLTSGATS